MMKTAAQIFFAALALSFYSCSPGDKYKKEIARLDSISSVLASADSMLKLIDTTAVEKISAEISANLKTINEKKFDTISKNSALLLDDYNGIEVSLEKSSSMIFVLQKDVKYSQMQTASLLNDLKKNIAEETKVKQLIETEQESAEKVYENSKMVSSAIKENILRFDSLNTIVKKFIEEMK